MSSRNLAGVLSRLGGLAAGLSTTRSSFSRSRAWVKASKIWSAERLGTFRANGVRPAAVVVRGPLIRLGVQDRPEEPADVITTVHPLRGDEVEDFRRVRRPGRAEVVDKPLAIRLAQIRLMNALANQGFSGSSSAVTSMGACVPLDLFADLGGIVEEESRRDGDLLFQGSSGQASCSECPFSGSLEP